MKKTTTKHTYRVRNWKQYNTALVNRGSLTLWIDPNVASAWYNQELSGKRGASDLYSDLAIETILMLKEVYHLPLRQAEGFVRSIIALMKLDLEVPNYSVVCRRRKRLSVSLGAITKGEAVHVLIDSTGLKVYGEGEWKTRQHGISKRRTWRKMHLAIDPSSHQIIAAEVTTNDVADGTVLESLLNQIEGPIERVTGDGAYDTRTCYGAIAQRKARPIIPPRRGAKIWEHGNRKTEPHPRDENLRGIRKKGRKRWKRESGYHTRSLAETAMYRFKTIFGGKLATRLFESQCAEVFIKLRALNIMTRLGLPDTYVVA